MGVIMSPMNAIEARPIVTGTIVVFYSGHLIALVNDKGRIIWRDMSYPMFLLEYIINNPVPQSEWN
jgi:hypothetical protein